MKTLYAPEALLPSGWARDVVVEIGDDGAILSVRGNRLQGTAEHAGGPLLPGMADAHSHAFQRALAGQAERMGTAEDGFWNWREVMYAFMARIGPTEAHAIAARLYCELLRNGYTSVAEFHYLHHMPDGRPYARPAEMGLACLRAARETGIAITILPSLYRYSNFGALPLAGAQRRFASDPERVLAMLVELREACPGNPDARFGVAPHSLRAVDPASLQDLLAGLDAIDPTAPVHILAAEQVREVNDCMAWSDLRPIQWLLDNAPVNERWCLVHCTHAATAETERLAASGAVVCLCPSTEGNLGDGVFALSRYLEKNGRYAIGSGSNLSQDPVEELRWLEYGQRLQLRRRNVTATPARSSVGTGLWSDAARGGGQALGRASGSIAAGQRADLVVLDGEHVNLEGRSGDRLMDSLVFTGNECLVKHVMVGGRWVVRDRRHPLESEIEKRYRRVQRQLFG